jgi:hypothetical protein
MKESALVYKEKHGRRMGNEVKLKLSLCLTKHQAIKMYGGTGGISTGAASILYEGGLSTSRPCPFAPGVYAKRKTKLSDNRLSNTVRGYSRMGDRTV